MKIIEKASRRTLNGQAPAWVTWFTDVGRPLSAVVVMVLCAPGERHLAELAGWGPNLSWGMAGLLVMYAGIAAVVATVRPKGAPGKRTAVWGAILSLLLAMAAQPVSHYFVTGWMTADPRPPFWLVTVVSCVPPFVMGHLLHLAADPGTERPEEDEETGRQARVSVAPTAVRRGYDIAAQEDEETGRTASAGEDGSERPGGIVSQLAGLPQELVSEFQQRIRAAQESVDEMNRTVSDPEAARLEEEAEIPWSNPATWTPDMADEPDVSDGGFPWLRGMEYEPSPLQGEFTDRPAGPRVADILSSHPGGHGVPVSTHTPNGVRAVLGFRPVGETPDSLRALQDGVRRMADTGAMAGRTSRDSGQRTEDEGSSYPDVLLSASASGFDASAWTADTDVRPAVSGEVARFVRELWETNPDMSKADVRRAARDRFPADKADTIRKAVTRAEEANRR